jgi:hypothetical protein
MTQEQAVFVFIYFLFFFSVFDPTAFDPTVVLSVGGTWATCGDVALAFFLLGIDGTSLIVSAFVSFSFFSSALSRAGDTDAPDDSAF